MDRVVAKNKWGVYSIPKSIEYTYTARTILNGQIHEDTTIEYLQSIGGNIIHSGSGFGDFLPALKECKTIWCFEPNPLMYSHTQETIRLNNLGNVKLFREALGDYNGTSFLKCQDELGHEMGPRSEISTFGETVQMTTLDTIIPQDINIDLIHLDLEGWEFHALDGSKELIKRCRPIIVLEIDGKAVEYNNYMLQLNYIPYKQLIFNSNEQMVFVNTVYHPKERVDKEYWNSDLPVPLSPSNGDVEIFKSNLISGTTLMLGCTKKLIEISSNQLDLDPWYNSTTIIIGDWRDNTTYFDNIITDGGLSFTQELGDKIVEMASKNCKRFIARTFTKKLPIMRVADWFPKQEDFKIEPNRVIEFENYSFYIWDF